MRSEIEYFKHSIATQGCGILILKSIAYIDAGSRTNYISILQVLKEGCLTQALSDNAERLRTKTVKDEGVLYMEIIGVGGYGVVHRVQ